VGELRILTRTSPGSRPGALPRSQRKARSAQAARPAIGAPRLALNLPGRLTADQQAVLRLLARGLNNSQIAIRLERKRRWVCYRVAELKVLLGVQARKDLSCFTG
jgi:DNA-binding NarL/FixJ family response regulator